MMNDERAVFMLDRYGDDLYRFAFILTGDDKDAAEVFSDAFAEVTGKKLFTGTDKDDRRLLFSQIYKNSSKRRISDKYDDKYGKKSDTFYEVMKLPHKERALNHLMMYEDMTEKEAKEVIKAL